MQIKDSKFVHVEWYNTGAGIIISKIKYQENANVSHKHTHSYTYNFIFPESLIQIKISEIYFSTI